MTHRGGVNAVGFFPLCKSHSLKCHDFGSGSCNLEQKTSGGNTDWRINFFFILKRDSWWVLPPLPAAALSSHRESAEYSEQKFRAVWSNLGWSLDTRKRRRLLVPAWSAVGNTSEHRASFLHKRYLEKPAPDPPRSVPLAPACRGELPVLPAPPFPPQCSPVCDCSTPRAPARPLFQNGTNYAMVKENLVLDIDFTQHQIIMASSFNTKHVSSWLSFV